MATILEDLNDREVQTRTRIVELARSFHTLRRADGLEPWNADKFARWAGFNVSDYSRQAAAFVLMVWNRHHPWKFGKFLARFDLAEALLIWDQDMRAAWQDWAADPWFA